MPIKISISSPTCWLITSCGYAPIPGTTSVSRFTSSNWVPELELIVLLISSTIDSSRVRSSATSDGDATKILKSFGCLGMVCSSFPSSNVSCIYNSPLNTLSSTDGNNAANSSRVWDCNSRSDADCMSLRAHFAKQPSGIGDCFFAAYAPRNDMILIVLP